MSSKVMLKTKSNQLKTTDFDKFEGFLTEFNLPTENIIASTEERHRIMNALPEFLMKLPNNAKKDARYLSKFVAGAAIGLFDASLNYVWNEVVLNLRKKVIAYGIDYFYNNAIGESLREHYKDEDDLQLVKDQVLLDTCKKLEIISEILYKKLCHMLDMRNHIGASHPNEYSINAYELLGWLQNCINDLFLDDISDSAITIKSIIENTKKMDKEIDEEYLAHFNKILSQLSTNMISNLLISIFGIFVSPSTSKITQSNFLELGIIAWEHSNESVKYELGKKIDVYRSNLDNEKTNNAELFFSKCNGKMYYSIDAKTIKLTLLMEQLEHAHYGWDNYVNEKAYAKDIMSFFNNINDIPKNRLEVLIDLFLKCRIGNDRWYNDGVSPTAQVYYDEFFKMLDEESVKIVIKRLSSKEMENLLSGNYRPNHIKTICKIMLSDTFSDRLKEIIQYIINYESSKFDLIFIEKKFKVMSKDFI